VGLSVGSCVGRWAWCVESSAVRSAVKRKEVVGWIFGRRDEEKKGGER